jgi:FMN phosphatase YigB (HAD superfamily)
MRWQMDFALDQALINGAKAVTLDIFDTLLFRRCGVPEAVFAAVARRGREAGAFAEPAMSDWFVRLRGAAEPAALRQIAPAGRSILTLDDIYRALPESLGDIDRLRELEWEIEQEEIRANPFLVDLLHTLDERDCPVLLVSDMHLATPQIIRLLTAAGVPRRLYREALVSCDLNCSKASGELFSLALERLGDIQPCDVLHIGDNPHADIAMARQHGLQTIHYALPARQRAVQEREAILHAHSTSSLAAQRTIAAHLVPEDSETDSFWFHAGACLIGPVVDVFARWVLARCHQRGTTRIAPIMREGAVFADTMRLYARSAKLDLDIRPIYLSRAALHLPMLETFDRGTVQSFLGTSVYRTLDALLAIWGDPKLPEEMEPLRHRLVAELTGETSGRENIAERLIDLLLTNDNRARVVAQAQEQRQLLLDYLALEFGADERIALVDLGAQCSTGAALHQQPDLTSGRRFDNYLLYGVANLSEKLMQGMSIDVFAPVDQAGLQRSAVIQRSPQIIELLLNGNAATTLSFERDSAGRSQPVTTVPVSDARQQARLAAVHAGIRAFSGMAARIDPFDPAIEPDADARQHALDILHRMTHMPTPEEAKEFGSLLYDYTGEAAVRPVIDEPGLDLARSLLPLGQPHLLKLALLTQRATLQWPQGTLTQLVPDLITGLHEGSRPDSGHGVATRLLLARVLAAKETSIIVCAAGGEGGMGPSFIATAREAGLSLAGYIDHFPERVQGTFHGVPVFDRSTIATVDCNAFAVISTGYGQQLVKLIKQTHADRPEPPRLYWIEYTA